MLILIDSVSTHICAERRELGFAPLPYFGTRCGSPPRR